MTIAEITTASIALLALVVSSITAYLTLIARFHANVLPRHRPFLTQIDGTTCLVLECEFINDGAKPGSIEDLLVELIDEEGNRFVFSPYLVKDQFNIYQDYKKEDFTTFSGISLGARQRREYFIVFRPTQTDFKPQAGVISLRTYLCVNISKDNWNKSPVKFSVKLSDENIQQWLNKTGSTQQVPAIEIGNSRRNFIQKQQS